MTRDTEPTKVLAVREHLRQGCRRNPPQVQRGFVVARLDGEPLKPLQKPLPDEQFKIWRQILNMKDSCIWWQFWHADNYSCKLCGTLIIWQIRLVIIIRFWCPTWTQEWQFSIVKICKSDAKRCKNLLSVLEFQWFSAGRCVFILKFRTSRIMSRISAHSFFEIAFRLSMRFDCTNELLVPSWSHRGLSRQK